MQEPVTVQLQVRRGDKLIMVMGVPINGGPAGWYSPNPDHDIQTLQGAIQQIVVLVAVRQKDGSLWRNGVPMFVRDEPEDLPTPQLTQNLRQELEEELPF